MTPEYARYQLESLEVNVKLHSLCAAVGDYKESDQYKKRAETNKELVYQYFRELEDANLDKSS